MSLPAPTYTVIGVDPGTVGAIAVLDDRGGLLVIDLPTHTLLTSTGKRRNEPDLASLVSWLTQIAPAITHVFVERVASRPGEGSVSSFRFGFATGALHGVVAALGLPMTPVSPQTWQRTQGVGPGPDAARQRAVQLFPHSAEHLARKSDNHRADALLIARHGLMLVNTAAQALAH